MFVRRLVTFSVRLFSFLVVRRLLFFIENEIAHRKQKNEKIMQTVYARIVLFVFDFSFTAMNVNDVVDEMDERTVCVCATSMLQRH